MCLAAGQPLVIGDRVVLSKTFFTPPNTDGWCLGKAGQQTVGVVLFAPEAAAQGGQGGQGQSGDQRAVLVCAEADANAPTAAPCAFRSSWLQRAVPLGYDDGSGAGPTKLPAGPGPTILAQARYFEAGDRVQLNPGTWKAKATETTGKCLGTPTDGLYGIVRSAGPVRDGVQRNIEVVAIDPRASTGGAGEVAEAGGLASTGGDGASGIGSGPAPRVSLYPSSSLVHAARRTVLASGAERDSLVAALEALVTELALPALRVRVLVDKFGLQVRCGVHGELNV